MSIFEERPILVGHRGYPARYPENTLAGFRGALTAGADAVECDVQFSRDGLPVIIHDPQLERTAGQPGRVSEMTLAELVAVSVHEPARLGDSPAPHPVPTLSQLVDLMAEFPEARLFVEIKEESFATFSRQYCVDQVMAMVAALGDRVVVISFDEAAVALAGQQGASTGWVIRRYNTQTRNSAEALAPDYLIADYHKLPAAPAELWPGDWRWFIYDLVDWPLAAAFVERGVTCIETWDPGSLRAQMHAPAE